MRQDSEESPVPIIGRGAQKEKQKWQQKRDYSSSQFFQIMPYLIIMRDFPGGAVVKNPPANAGDMGSIPGPGRSHMPQSN